MIGTVKMSSHLSAPPIQVKTRSSVRHQVSVWVCCKALGRSEWDDRNCEDELQSVLLCCFCVLSQSLVLSKGKGLKFDFQGHRAHQHWTDVAPCPRVSNLFTSACLALFGRGACHAPAKHFMLSVICFCGSKHEKFLHKIAGHQMVDDPSALYMYSAISSQTGD